MKIFWAVGSKIEKVRAKIFESHLIEALNEIDIGQYSSICNKIILHDTIFVTGLENILIINYIIINQKLASLCALSMVVDNINLKISMNSQGKSSGSMHGLY